MKRIYAILTIFCFSVSLIAAITIPAQSQEPVPTFDSGESFSGPDDVLYGEGSLLYYLFGKPKPEPAPVSTSNRLLVITEPTWCQPCRLLDPVLKDLKKQGYDIHEYTQAEWRAAKGKPQNLPEKLVKEGGNPRVPTLLFIKVDKKDNKVLHWSRGWTTEKNEKYIKKFLRK